MKQTATPEPKSPVNKPLAPPSPAPYEPATPQPATPTTIVAPVAYAASDPRVAAMTSTLSAIAQKHGDAGAAFVNLFNSYFQQILSGLKGN